MNIIKEFIELDIDLDNNNLESESQNLLENINDINNNNNKRYNYNNLLYLIGIFSLTFISIYILYNTNIGNFYINNITHSSNLNEIGKILYKLSAELSNSSTVCSWEIIHKVLKELETEDILKLISELEKLKKMDLDNPGQYSTNSNFFQKSLIKLIYFLKNI